MSISDEQLYPSIRDTLAEHLFGSNGEPRAETEGKKLADTLTKVTALVDEGRLTRPEAAALIRMQALASQAELMTVEGIGLIRAQNAINAALEAVRAVVVKAAGSVL